MSAAGCKRWISAFGPRPDGTIPPEAEARLREIGAWLATNGGSIYGTRAGPIAPRSWG